MNVIYNDLWADFPVGTEVQSIPGWATSASYSNDLSGIVTNGSGLLDNVVLNPVVVTYDTGSDDHFVQMAITKIVNYQGCAVRIVDVDNYIGYFKLSATSVRVVHVVAGVRNTIQDISGFTHEIGGVAELSVEDNVLKFLWNDVQYGTDMDATGMHEGATGAGAYLKSGVDISGDISVGNYSTDSITLDPYPQNRVFPTFGGVCLLPVSGSYQKADAPSVIKVKVEEYVSNTVLVDWTVVDADLSGGVFSGEIEVPKAKYCRVLVRFDDDNSIVAQSGKVGFGFLILLGGQSGTVRWTSETSVTTVPHEDTCIFDGVGSWALPTDEPIIDALNVIAAENNCCVAVFNTAVNSSAIATHLPSGANHANTVAAIAAAGGKINNFFWGHGESDTSHPYNAAYFDNLGLLRADLLSVTGQPSSEIPMFIAQLGRKEGITGDVWNVVRQAQTNFANANADVHISHQTIDLPMSDTLHREDAGRLQAILRFADSFNNLQGTSNNSGRGPIPLGASLEGNEVTIFLNLNGSAGVTLPVGCEECFGVSVDGFDSTISVESISTVGNTITLVLDSVPTGEVEINSHTASDPDHTKMPRGDLTYGGVGVAVEPLFVAIESSSDSTLTLTATGIPDGSYSFEIWDASQSPMIRVSVENITFSSGTAALQVPLNNGTLVKSICDGNNPPVTGVLCYGVTQ